MFSMSVLLHQDCYDLMFFRIYFVIDHWQTIKANVFSVGENETNTKEMQMKTVADCTEKRRIFKSQCVNTYNLNVILVEFILTLKNEWKKQLSD